MRDFALAGLGVIALVMAFLGGAALSHDLALARAPKPGPDAALLGRVAELERRADEQAKIRCLNVSTTRMDLAIFPIDRLETRKP